MNSFKFVDLFAGREGQMERIIASLANNALPLSSLRNDIKLKLLRKVIKK